MSNALFGYLTHCTDVSLQLGEISKYACKCISKLEVESNWWLLIYTIFTILFSNNFFFTSLLFCKTSKFKNNKFIKILLCAIWLKIELKKLFLLECVVVPDDWFVIYPRLIVDHSLGLFRGRICMGTQVYKRYVICIGNYWILLCIGKY